MAGGLFALLDDVAALARLAAASTDDVAAAAGRASAKAAGVVIDDTAVTPRYVQGLAAERELPIIKRIAIGSLRNKLLFILPIALVLSEFLPIAVTILLMLGGTYLCFEGAEKIIHALKHRREHGHESAVEREDEDVATEKIDEDEVVSGAVRTDFILSGEIMVIALKSVTDQPLVSRAIILAVVAVLITVLVYGFVALIVKMDDVGLSLIEGGKSEKFGRFLVNLMPKVMAFLSTGGVVAMLWVGGHILLVGTDELGFHPLYSAVHHVEEAVHEATGALGGVLGWLTNTVASGIFGLIVGTIVALIVTPILAARDKSKGEAPAH